MSERPSFVHKLLKSFDRVDKEAVRSYVLDLAKKNELYQAMLDELQEGVVLTSPDGLIQFANHQAMAWLGLDAASIGKARLTDCIEDPFLRRFVSSHLQNPKARAVENFQILSPREVSLRAFLIPLDGSCDKEILILLVNISDKKNREFDSERLARIEAMVSLAAGVAHEIGNPLNSIAIHLELLKKEIKDFPAVKRKVFEKTLSVLNAETARLDKIVRNFLKATRKPPLRFRPENLNDLIEEAIRVMDPELKKHRILVHFRLDRDLVPSLMDRERLHQVFMNLIKNAMEAMPHGGLLKISTTHKDNVAVVRFQDEGAGISEEDLPHIFDAYYTTKEEGSGLGLMMVFNAIREHGGRIEVASKIGKGSTFTLLIPIRRPKLQLSQQKVSERGS